MASFNPFDKAFWLNPQGAVGFQSMGPGGQTINPGGVNLGDPRTAAMLGIAGGLLEAGGWQAQPVSFGQALGMGLRQGAQSYQSAVKEMQARQAQQVQEGLQRAQQAKLDREAKQAEDYAAYVATLDPEMRAFAARDPEGFFKATMSGGGWLEGTGIEAQMYNNLDAYTQKINAGLPVTEDETRRARMSYNRLSAPRVQTMSDGTTVTITPNVGAFPTSRNVPQPVQVEKVLDEPVTAGPVKIERVEGLSGTEQKEFRTRRSAIDRAELGVDTFEEVYKETGTEVVPGAQKDRLSSAFRQMQVSLKDFYELGALQAADMELIEGVIQDPTTMTAAVKERWSELTGLLDPDQLSPVEVQIATLRAAFDKARKEVDEKEREAGGKSRGKSFTWDPELGLQEAGN